MSQTTEGQGPIPPSRSQGSHEWPDQFWAIYLWKQGAGEGNISGGTVLSCRQIRTAFQKAPVTGGHDAEPDNTSFEGNPTGSGCGQKESQHPHPGSKIWSLKDALGEMATVQADLTAAEMEGSWGTGGCGLRTQMTLCHKATLLAQTDHWPTPVHLSLVLDRHEHHWGGLLCSSMTSETAPCRHQQNWVSTSQSAVKSTWRSHRPFQARAQHMVGLGITRRAHSWACLLRTVHKQGVKELISSLKFKFKCMSKITRLIISGNRLISKGRPLIINPGKSGRSSQYPLVSTDCTRRRCLVLTLFWPVVWCVFLEFWKKFRHGKLVPRTQWGSPGPKPF